MKRIDGQIRVRGFRCFGGHSRYVAATIRLCALFLASLCSLGGSADAQDHVWSQLVGGPGNSVGFSVATDAAGNVILGGEFDDTMTVGSDTVVTSPLSNDAFVTKLSASGTPLWTVQIGGPGEDTLAAVAVDQAGSVAVTGVTAGEAIFLMLLDGEDGSVVWSRDFAGDDYTFVAGVAFDDSDNVVMAGGFRGSADFGGGLLNSVGSYDIVLASYDNANGSHRWSRRFGATGDDLADALAVGSGVIAITGNFSPMADLGNGPHSTNGLHDMFVATYSASDGAPIWSKTFGGTGYDGAHAVALDAQGSLLVTGYFGLFGGPVDFGGGSVASQGGADVFLAKYDVDGSHQWSRTFGGVGDDYGFAVTVDSAGNPILTGSFQISGDFGGAPHASAGQFDSFVAHYTAAGEYDWSHSYGSTVTEKGLAVATDPNDQILLTGFTLSDVDFGGGTLVNSGFADAYLVKLSSAESAPAPSSDCPTSPDASCATGFQRGMLLFGTSAGERGLLVKMLRGPALEQTDAGNPLDSAHGGSGTSFSLCVYNENQALAGNLTVDRAGEICAGGSDCWEPIGKAPNDPTGPGQGYSYDDDELAADGVQTMVYRGGSNGRTRVLLRAKGANLPSSIAQQLQGSTQATVQLHSSDGVCLSLTLNGRNGLFNRANRNRANRRAR
jgi:hypothetical protein